MPKRPTIATVAEQAGVAVSTVSRYLNGHYVSQSVRTRLSEVIAELGYSRSWTARNLSLGRRGCIGVVVDSSQDPWFVQLLAGIEEELATRDASLMLASLELRGRYDPSVVFEWLRGHRVDGIIVAKSQRRERALFHAALEAHVPVVAVAPDETVPQALILRCNNLAGGTLVAQYLADLGHRRIAFAGGPAHASDSKHRLRGLRDGLEARGIALDPEWVVACDTWEVESGSALAETWLAKPFPPTAVVFANDALAIGFMRVALKHGIRMPADLSVIGFDGLPQGALLFPALTTVAQPMREMGRVATERLFDALGDPGRVERVEFPVDLLIRESTGPAAGPAPNPVPPLRLVP